MLVSFDERGYNYEIEKGLKKISIFRDALKWAEKHIIVTDKKEFAKSFSKYFMMEYYESNKDKIKLDIKVDKLLDLVGINIMELRFLEDNFNQNNAVIEYGDILKPIVDKAPFELWTNSSEQNEKLRAGRKLIEVINQAGEHTKIYPADIQRATSNFLTYDIRKQEYQVNVHWWDKGDIFLCLH